MGDVHKRVLIKLSGEFLREDEKENFSAHALDRLVSTLRRSLEDGLQFGCVVGAGNIFRGKESAHMQLDRVIGDQVGMLATIMNALVVRDALSRSGVVSHVMAMNAHVPSVLDHDPLLARSLIAKGEPVFFAGGTGNPYFTTDSAATVRALEIQASLLVKSTKVNGVYSEDPIYFPDAERFSEISFEQALERRLKIMDPAAIALAMEQSLPIFVCKFGEPESLVEAMQDKSTGTYILPKGK